MNLPLHIFEPRYCEMLEDALGQARTIEALYRSAALGTPVEPLM